MSQDVDLSALQYRMDQSSLPFWRQGLPTLLLLISLFASALAVIGRPVLGYGEAVIFHGALLVGAIVFRNDSPLAGSIRLAGMGEPRDGARLRDRIEAFGEPGDPEAHARRRRLFVILFAALVGVGTVLLTTGDHHVRWIPAMAAGWVFTSASLAWLGCFLALRPNTAVASGVAAAGLLCLLMLLVVPPHPGSAAVLLGSLAGFVAGLGCCAAIVTSDPSRDLVLRLTSTASFPGGICKLDPLQAGTRMYLKFQLDENSPILALKSPAGADSFRAIETSATAQPITLNDERLWILNLRKLSEVIGSEVQLEDSGQFVRSKARITQVLRPGDYAGEPAISAAAIDAAAKNILVSNFTAIVQTAALTAFRSHAAIHTQKLADIRDSLRAAETELAELEEVGRPESAAFSDGPSAAALKTRIEEKSAEFEATLAELKASSEDASATLTAQWLGHIAQRLLKDQSGPNASLAEANRIIALLGLELTVVEAEDGPKADQIRERLAGLLTEVKLRAKEERDRKRQREDLEHKTSVETHSEMLKELFRHPSTATYIAEMLAKDPSQLERLLRMKSGAAAAPSEEARQIEEPRDRSGEHRRGKS